MVVQLLCWELITASCGVVAASSTEALLLTTSLQQMIEQQWTRQWCRQVVFLECMYHYILSVGNKTEFKKKKMTCKMAVVTFV